MSESVVGWGGGRGGGAAVVRMEREWGRVG